MEITGELTLSTRCCPSFLPKAANQNRESGPSRGHEQTTCFACGGSYLRTQLMLTIASWYLDRAAQVDGETSSRYLYHARRLTTS
jgi:hypothetical protein